MKSRLECLRVQAFRSSGVQKTICVSSNLPYIPRFTFHVSHFLCRTYRATHLLIYGPLILLFGLCVIPADAKKPDVKSKVGKTTISGYTQVQFQATNRHAAVPNTTFTVRRGRLQLDAELKKALSMRLEFEGTTAGVEASDLYLRYNVSRSLTLKAGQVKKPFSYARLQAARKLRIIERPLHVREDFRGYLGRDVGLVAEVEPVKEIEFTLGIFNGAGTGIGAEIDNNNAKDFAGRVEFKPTKDLRFGFNASSHNFTQVIQNRVPVVTEGRFTAYGADVVFEVGELKLIAEGLFADKLEIGSNTQIIGLYVTGVYKREVTAYGIAAMEHGGRIEFRDSDDAINNKDALISVIPYVGFYFHSNARIQVNPILRFPQEGEVVLEFITQAQIEF